MPSVSAGACAPTAATSAAFRVAVILGMLLLRGSLPTMAPQALAQDPAPTASPSPSPEPPKLYEVSIEGGPVVLSTPAETKPFVLGQARMTATLWRDYDFGLLSSIKRDPNGAAQTINGMISFPDLSLAGWARYRIAQSIIKVGAIGEVTWGYDQAGPTPRLWTIEAVGCVEKFLWWSAGGEGCLGIGKRDIVAGAAVSGYITQPISGPVFLRVQFDIPWNKVPQILVNISELAPLAGKTPPTPQEIIAVAQKLPIRVEAGVLVRGWSRKF